MLLSRFKISGHSMSPNFPQGSNVIASSLPLLFSKPKKGDVVVFEKFNRYYIKRIESESNGKYMLVGDNKSDSFDSRRFGSVKREQIKAKIIAKI
jgi:phage repressor protein C with HTH and peptisase S24 domain